MDKVRIGDRDWEYDADHDVYRPVTHVKQHWLLEYAWLWFTVLLFIVAWAVSP